MHELSCIPKILWVASTRKIILPVPAPSPSDSSVQWDATIGECPNLGFWGQMTDQNGHKDGSGGGCFRWWGCMLIHRGFRCLLRVVLQGTVPPHPHGLINWNCDQGVMVKVSFAVTSLRNLYPQPGSNKVTESQEH